MSKNVVIPTRSAPSKSQQAAADRFVNGSKKAPQAGKLIRVTFDLEVELHRRMKTYCSANGLTMVDEVRELLDKHFPPLPTVRKQ